MSTAEFLTSAGAKLLSPNSSKGHWGDKKLKLSFNEILLNEPMQHVTHIYLC